MNLLKLYYHLLVFIKNVLIKILNEIEKYIILLIKIISKQSKRNKIIGMLIIILLVGIYYNSQKNLVYICKSTNPIVPVETLFFKQSSKIVSFGSIENIKFNYIESSDTLTFETGDGFVYVLNTVTNILMKQRNFIITYECKKN